MVQFSTKIKEELLKALNDLKVNTGISIVRMVNEAIEKYIKEKK